MEWKKADCLYKDNDPANAVMKEGSETWKEQSFLISLKKKCNCKQCFPLSSCGELVNAMDCSVGVIEFEL